jgi:hypothetical protein
MNSNVNVALFSLFVLTIGCATSKSTSPASKSRDAAAITADLLGGSKQTGLPKDRAITNCYPACNDGSACNEDTAICELIPCHRKCRPDQVCNRSGMIESCVKVQPVEGAAPAAAPAELITPQ